MIHFWFFKSPTWADNKKNNHSSKYHCSDKPINWFLNNKKQNGKKIYKTKTQIKQQQSIMTEAGRNIVPLLK